MSELGTRQPLLSKYCIDLPGQVALDGAGPTKAVLEGDRQKRANVQVVANRLVVEAIPDSQLEEKRDQEERSKLDLIKKTLSPEQIKEVQLQY